MEHKLQLEKLYTDWRNCSPQKIERIQSNSASPRLYFRIHSNDQGYIGAYNADIRENKAFFYYSEVFRKAGIHVPEIYSVSKNEAYYLLQDLGDINLLTLLKEQGESEYVKTLYKKAIEELLKIQTLGTQQIDFNNFAYPRAEFDAQSVLWDLNYFKYYFLKLSGIVFDEQLLENDFKQLTQEVGKQQLIAFMFRDFQARNIQVIQDDVWLIDYQGGRKGPVLYDLVSLLYQASAQLSMGFREELKSVYKHTLKQHVIIDDEQFEHDFNTMLFIRIIQTLGTYGYRGLIEKKSYFVESIPLALENLENLLQSHQLKIEIPYFIELLNGLLQLKSKFVI